MIKERVISLLMILVAISAFYVQFSIAGHNEDPVINQEKQYPAHIISAKSIISKLNENKDIVLVDVRDGKDFEKVRIPGSLNIPLFALKTKAFLKKGNLILVNQGYKYKELERECGRLREKGFSVRVLYGGLNSWREEGGTLEGDARAIKALNRISPSDLFSEKDDEDRMAISLSKTRGPDAASLIPNSISIPFDNEKDLAVKLKGVLTRRNTDSPFSILIFDKKGEQYEKVEKAVQETKAGNVFYLTGGLEAYKEFLDRQSMMGNVEKVGSDESTGCGTCQ